MNLKDIIAKIGRGEELSADEKAGLTAEAFQEAIDAAAAAARRKAEGDKTAAEQRAQAAEAEAKRIQDEAEAKANEKKPEVERLKGEIVKLQNALAEREKAIEGLKAEGVKMTRAQKVAAIMAKAKIAFVAKVDGEAMTEILKNRLADLDVADLDDDTKTGPIVKAFVSANEAAIVDASGHGSGGDPTKRGANFKGSTIKNPWKKESLNLTLQGQVLRDDPDLAKRLQAEAKQAA